MFNQSFTVPCPYCSREITGSRQYHLYATTPFPRRCKRCKGIVRITLAKKGKGWQATAEETQWKGGGESQHRLQDRSMNAYPMWLVERRENGLDHLSCGHTLATPPGSTWLHPKRRRCQQCGPKVVANDKQKGEAILYVETSDCGPAGVGNPAERQANRVRQHHAPDGRQ